jgi:hypothetical protein
MIAAIPSTFGFLWREVGEQGKRHFESMEKASAVLSSVASTQAVMMVKIDRLEKNADEKK